MSDLIFVICTWGGDGGRPVYHRFPWGGQVSRKKTPQGDRQANLGRGGTTLERREYRFFFQINGKGMKYRLFVSLLDWALLSTLSTFEHFEHLKY